MTRLPGTHPRNHPPTTVGAGQQHKDVLRRLAAIKGATTANLKQEWRILFGVDPPAFNRAFLESRLMYRIQELVHGGLNSQTVARLEALGETLDGGNSVRRRVRADDRPIAGTRLIREHRGVEHVVTVLPDGFEYEGRLYRSLSAIARYISGTNWNGWVFFGLRSRSGA